MALKEVILSINEKLDQIFSIIAPLPTSSIHRDTMTKNSSSKIDSNMCNTPYSTHPKHDTLPIGNQSDLYELMSSALLPTIYDPLNHPHKLKPTLLTALLSQPKNSQEIKYSSTYSSNLSAKSYNTGTLHTLQKNLPQPPYSKDLWKPP